ncbi:MAG: OmpA family protein [Gemmatimonadaceae bacterium]
MNRITTVLSMSVLLAGSAVACRKKPEPAPQPVVSAPATDANAAQHRADSIAAANAAQHRADSIAAANRAVSANDPATQAAIRRVLTQTVYFDYDKDVLRDDTRATLDAKAAILAANGGVTLVITGHTDEQGTSEYNLALGQRRAAQVKRYLATKGVMEDRMTTQSLGDSQPASQGSDEASYALNRRAEFEPRNASGVLMRARQ